MRNKNYLYVLVFFLCFGTAAASEAAEEQNGGVPGDWLSRYMGARTLGFGGAFVAAADEPFGAVWNPACLTRIFQNEMHFETAILFEETMINGFSFAAPASALPSFGFTVISLRSGEFERTNELNERLGVFRESETAFLLSASKAFTKRFAVGANLKIVRQSIEDFGSSGVGADFGIMYDLHPAVRLGASLLNVGGPSLTLRRTDETYPVELRGGLSILLLGGRSLLTAEMDRRSGLGTGLRAGTEFWLNHVMALRVGYCGDTFTGGFSFRVDPGWRFDYGMLNHELGMTYRIGLSYRFGGFHAFSQADPPVFSPIGERSVTKFDLRARTKADAGAWSLEIVNKSNNVVRRFGGRGAPPSHVMWDGKDGTGLTLPDGVYGYRLAVVDVEGREIVGQERTVEITTEGPRGSVPVVIE